ncbi:nucleotide sugar dehydrogenase [Exiguobacterium sp. RIT452]|uniref:UDP-N-acetyl-D-mannosamine dehydrogenase n=1 Tax=Exiguobacterium undae TaxID=169177 RepID=A0ABX2VD13_9BACL|nr:MULTISPECIES: nucleotide sugar dehydrogenase [Exiguobacterium]OAN16129.1 UDP-N-acetyl-D-mannosamine dehydrogenase [Exiguobacterium undae]RJP01900.1 nucleotide sugar dehydrogenase [Exiguobacterium sp. RIT452]
MKLCTIGLGYIGLPSSAMFADHGTDVVGVDIDPRIVKMLNAGDIHIEEPGLEDVIKRVVANGKFRATLTPEPADVFLIAVPTPNLNDTYKSCDLKYVLSAVQNMLPHVQKGNVIIVESTIAPRTMDDHVRPLIEAAGFVIGQDVFVVHCPERVLPGQILHELIHNNRIVGGLTPACADAGAAVYETFVQGEIVKTDAKTAEMSKLMENTFRDVNIALANELTQVCHKLEINVLDVIEMANMHPRVNLHHPGPGVGGHCLAVDPYFIVAKAPSLARIIHTARETNVNMPHFVAEQAERLVASHVRPKIAVFGVTYKGNVDDMRESPAVDVIEQLIDRGMDVAVCDPHVERSISSRFELVDEIDAIQGADLALVLVDHDEFKQFDSRRLANQMRTPVLFDTKGIVQPLEDITVLNFGNLHTYQTTEVDAKAI